MKNTYFLEKIVIYISSNKKVRVIVVEGFIYIVTDIDFGLFLVSELKLVLKSILDLINKLINVFN
ncbi:hypothetical protein [Tepidibacter thalassicus]|uniref:hypothetical protein n=1 Tax=Tepidibacter thalassicus TaxID=214905 RepID=UPI0009324874|nr:hypothetical protein [Tepidibacter thalassicus]